jgi:hypothetical protein
MSGSLKVWVDKNPKELEALGRLNIVEDKKIMGA